MKQVVLMILLLAIVNGSHAELSARLDRNNIVMGESVTLELTLDRSSNSQPDFTLLDAVFHVGSTGTASSTQIINGEVKSQTTWQVLLVPKSIGSHIIPPLEVDGEKSSPLKLEVKKPDPNAKAQGDIFIEVIPNKTSAYVQEEIILTVRLLYAINLKNGGLSDPQADGLIVSQINKGANYTTQRDGKSYQVLERKYALYAEQSGPLELNPIIFEGEVTDNSRRNAYTMFQRGRPIRQVSPMLSLDIKPIPNAFVSQAWTPASDLSLSESWSKGEYKVGEPITRTIHIVATGLSETQLPEIKLPPIEGAKVYQDKVDTMTRTDGERLIATKTINFAIIPEQEGDLIIPEFTLKWFNTATDQGQETKLASTLLSIGAPEYSNPNTQVSVLQPSTTLNDKIQQPQLNQELSAQPSLWKSIALTFASLWVITTIYLLQQLRSHKAQTPKRKQPKTNPLDINLKALNQATPSRIQKTLIAWWNQQHKQQVTNLSQIGKQITHPEAKKSIDQLQLALYQKAGNDLKIDWYKLVKSGAFDLKQNKTSEPIGLPTLYH